MLKLLILSLTLGALGADYYASECYSNPYIEDAGPLVSTDSGKVVGKYVNVEDSKIATFLGVPYAEPPIGVKRFLKPDPVQPWKGLLAAQETPPPCMQYSSRNFSWIPTYAIPSEDCLFLNIWVPSNCCCGAHEKLPVLVWIHGGGYYSGSSGMEIYDGSVMASRGNVIVVSMNYRLGVFGFLSAGTAQAPGNAGLHDQVLSLQWIKQNIGYFGGDPESVTVFGESAGAWSVSLHLVSPHSKGLFHRAIMQSGSAYSPTVVDELPVAIYKANTFAQVAGCSDEASAIQFNSYQVIECLKHKDALDLAILEDIFTSKVPSFFMPSRDNDFLYQSPIEAFRSGDFLQVPVVIGVMGNETTVFLNYIQPELFPLKQQPAINMQVAKAVLDGIVQSIPSLDSNKIFEFYFQNGEDKSSDDLVMRLEQLFGDFTFRCPAMFLAEKLNTVYMYYMTYRSPLSPHAHWVGTPHFEDVKYVFGKPIRDSDEFSSEDKKFSEDVLARWVNFAKTGYLMYDDADQSWPIFIASQPTTYELNGNDSKLLVYPSYQRCEFWRPYFHAAGTPRRKSQSFKG